MHFLQPYTSKLLSILRIMTGLLFLQNGTTKIFDLPFTELSSVPLMSIEGIAGLLDLVRGFMIVFGLFTRPIAFLISGMMAVPYFLVHAPKSFYPIANGGELAALYCFVFLFLAAAGSGSWGVDCVLKSRKAGR